VILRLCLAALRVYPEGWRERYELEVRALLEQSPATPATVIDLLRGALDAHLHPSFPVAAARQLRGTLVTTIYCGIAFAFLGAGFAKATEDAPFIRAEAAHGLLGADRIAVELLALACLAVVAVAGAPLALAVLQQACRGSRQLRRALLVAAIAGGAAVIVTVSVIALAHSVHGNGGTPGHLAFLAWIALVALAAAVAARSARSALLGAELDGSRLGLGVGGAWLLARLMLALTVAVALYTIALAAEAPGAAALSNGPLQFGTTVVLAGLATAMAIITALALFTARRGRLSLAR
jgi:hypothetical protein